MSKTRLSTEASICPQSTTRRGTIIKTALKIRPMNNAQIDNLDDDGDDNDLIIQTSDMIDLFAEDCILAVISNIIYKIFVTNVLCPYKIFYIS